MNKCREAFEKNRFWIGIFKADVVFKSEIGEFGLYEALNSRVEAEYLVKFNNKWVIWYQCWQSRQAEVDQLNKVLVERTKEWLEAIKLGTYFLDIAKPLKDEVDQLQSQINEMAEVGLSQESAIREKDKRIEELELALTQIKSWESHPKNYGIDFGSWGLRDFYRDLADKALRGERE